MRHWKTKEEMGAGFSHTQKQHKEFEYNSLIKVKPYEQNIMRTFYLCRDIWTQEQRVELRDYLNDLIVEYQSFHYLNMINGIKTEPSNYDEYREIK